MNTATHPTSADPVDLALRARHVIPGGVSSGQRRIPPFEDLVVRSTSGATLTDERGREYVDFHCAYGATILGHNDPDVERGVLAASKTIDHVGIGVTPAEIELAELVVKHIGSIERVFFTTSGSEATYHALRLARAATGRKDIVKFQGHYHGWHDSVILNVISPPERLNAKDPLSAGSLQAVIDATRVIPFNNAEALERTLEDRQVAAVILEPIPHAIGVVLPEPGFLQRVRELCSRFGTVLIFDEIVTGFRHSLGGYQELVGVRPDLTTVGKAMGNGYPIAALGGRADLMEQLATTPHGSVYAIGTYNGHPTMAAAGVATIRKLETEPVIEHIYSLGERLRTGLTELYSRLGIATVVAGQGSISAAYFMDGPVRDFADLLRNDDDLFVGYRQALVRRGFLELPLNLKRNTLTYAHTANHIDDLLQATEEAVTDVLRSRPAG